MLSPPSTVVVNVRVVESVQGSGTTPVQVGLCGPLLSETSPFLSLKHQHIQTGAACPCLFVSGRRGVCDGVLEEVLRVRGVASAG